MSARNLAIETGLPGPGSEQELAGLALALGAADVSGLSSEEATLLARSSPPAPARVKSFREQIREGMDPLGDAFCRLRSPEDRRRTGATFTPLGVVESMVAWAKRGMAPDQIVDPGTGSGRFLLSAGRAFPGAGLFGVELDPLAALLARANLSGAGLARRSRVALGDYRSATVPRGGRALYLGNPPYVRHHQIDRDWKQWLADTASGFGLEASQLAGMHVHFFLATLAHAAHGDLGCFLTPSEWLDVNYGRLVRELLVGKLGGTRVTVIEPTEATFVDAATTSAITCFEVGSQDSSIRLRRVSSASELGALTGGRQVAKERLSAAPRWSPLTRAGSSVPAGFVQLGELCRVHRGAVTGANKVWIAGPHSAGLPESVLFPSVTRAKELFRVGLVLDDPSVLRRVIDIPVDLDGFDDAERSAIMAFLRLAKQLGTDSGYVARNRRAWWSVGLRKPAPILATYMARRPPAFVRNAAGARHINIAHGIYPREPMTESMLVALVGYLSGGVELTQGRTYAGGLTKFEPKEMERLPVPSPDLLVEFGGQSRPA